MLITESLVSICHHTVDPFKHFTLPWQPFPAGNHYSVLCISVCFRFIWFVYFLLLVHMSELIQCLSYSDLFYLAQYPQVSAMLSQMARFHLFLWLSSTPYLYTTSSLFTRQWALRLVHILAVVNNTVMNIGVYISFKLVFSYYLVKNPEVE